MSVTPALPAPDGPGPRRDRVGAHLAGLAELLAVGIEVAGQVQVAESTWVLYGHGTYDGEVVVGEYHDAGEASAVLRAAPSLPRHPDLPRHPGLP
ncbi:MAG TPA: hypothetical protein VIL48_18275 [Acidimicrobiales bacterium]